MRTICTAIGHLEDGREIKGAHVWAGVHNDWHGVSAAAEDALGELHTEYDLATMPNRIRREREVRLKHFRLEVTFDYDLPVAPELHADSLEERPQ